MQTLKLGKYKHFKGGIYEVVGVAKHSETLEEYVLYKHLSGNQDENKDFWIRPITMFLETVTRDGKTFPRFEYIGDK